MQLLVVAAVVSFSFLVLSRSTNAQKCLSSCRNIFTFEYPWMNMLIKSPRALELEVRATICGDACKHKVKLCFWLKAQPWWVDTSVSVHVVSKVLF